MQAMGAAPFKELKASIINSVSRTFL